MSDEQQKDAATHAAVVERLKFFFSDANIRSDKFLRRELEKDENGGCVPIATLLRFNSIKRHTTDPSVIAAAAKDESLSGIVKLDGDGIGRVVPFDADKMEEGKKLSLYVKGLPVKPAEDGDVKKRGADGYDVSIDEVREAFAPYGVVALVRLRWFRPGRGKQSDAAGDDKDTSQIPFALGSAFVEFETKEAFDKAVEDFCNSQSGEGEDSTKKTLEIKGNKLDIRRMVDWLEEKDKKYKKRKKDDDETGESEKRQRTGGEEEEKEDQRKSPEKVEFKVFTLDWKKGCVIRLTGLPSDCDREAIRAAIFDRFEDLDEDFRKSGVYADYSRGQDDGAIRFNEPMDQIPTFAKELNDGEVTIAGAKVGSAVLLEGEEEEKYWKDFIDFKNKQSRQRAEEDARNRRSGGGKRRGRR